MKAKEGSVSQVLDICWDELNNPLFVFDSPSHL